MPVAVPAGRYEVSCSLDLPVFGKIEHTETVVLETVPADHLDRQLAKLTGEDPAARRSAMIDLRYFPDEGKKIVPALMALLAGEDATVRNLVLSLLTAFPKEAAEHVDRFLTIAEGGEGITVHEQAGAVSLLGRVAPASEQVEKALEKAAASKEKTLKQRAEYALKSYRARTKKPAKNTD